MLEIENRIFNTNFWIKNNLDTDLNAYEMVEQATTLNNAKLQGAEISERTFTKLEESWKIRKHGLLERNLSEAYLASHICENVIEGNLKNTLLPTPAIEVIKKIAAIDLYLTQQKRDNNKVEYNNFMEYLEICKNYELLKKDETYPFIIDTYFERFSSIINSVNSNLVIAVKEELEFHLQNTK